MLVSQGVQILSGAGRHAVYSELCHALMSIACPAGGQCVAVGGDGMALHTANRGTSWSAEHSGTSAARDGTYVQMRRRA